MLTARFLTACPARTFGGVTSGRIGVDERLHNKNTRIQDISKEKKTMSENEITMVDSTSCAMHGG